MGVKLIHYNAYVSDPTSALHATGLLSQISNFVTANPGIDANSLYVIWIGLNDYARNPLDPLTVVSNIESAVSSLAKRGCQVDPRRQSAESRRGSRDHRQS